MVQKTHAAVEGHEREQSSEIVVDNAAVSIGKRAKAENVSHGVFVIVSYEVGTQGGCLIDWWSIDDRPDWGHH
jgi:hypothetical protein